MTKCKTAKILLSILYPGHFVLHPISGIALYGKTPCMGRIIPTRKNSGPWRREAEKVTREICTWVISHINHILCMNKGFLGGTDSKESAFNAGDVGSIPGSGIYPGEKAMAPHSSTLAWKIPWTVEPGGLQSIGLQRVGRDWATSLSLFTFMHWRRKWQPTPVFLPGESQGWGRLVGCCLWGHTESATTEVT